MPTPITPKPIPVGNRTIRLADIPEPVRRRAALALMRQTDDTTEYARLFELVYAPGDAGGRITDEAIFKQEQAR